MTQKCEKCGSTNVIVQAKEAKNSIVWGFMMFFGGIGLMFLGPIGAIVGIVLGLIVGFPIKAFMPKMYETVVVCQDCGAVIVVKPNKKKQKEDK